MTEVDCFGGITVDELMILKEGSPKELSSRLEKEIKCYDFLNSIGIEYSRVDHNAADDMETCIEIEKVLGAPICKNLFLCNRQQTQFYLLMMPGDKVFKTKELSSQIGSARLSFANAQQMEKYLDITPGSVSVLGLMNDSENAVQLIIDEDIKKDEYIGVHPCVNTSTLKIKTSDMFDKITDALGHNYMTVKLVGEVE